MRMKEMRIVNLQSIPNFVCLERQNSVLHFLKQLSLFGYSRTREKSVNIKQLSLRVQYKKVDRPHREKVENMYGL